MANEEAYRMAVTDCERCSKTEFLEMRKLVRAVKHHRRALNKKDFGALVMLAKKYSHFQQPCRAAAYRIVLDGAAERQQADMAQWLIEDAPLAKWPRLAPKYGTPWGW